MRVLIIDNYDSFVHNVEHLCQAIAPDSIIRLRRNDAITLGEIEQWAPRKIILSPGPCGPEQAGICNDIVRHRPANADILGICLGHQVIGHVYGATITRAKTPMHGKASTIYHQQQGLLQHMPPAFMAGRYHSLIVENIPDDLQITAHCPDQQIMGLQHRTLPIFGVQFHPESILTPDGHHLIRHFLEHL